MTLANFANLTLAQFAELTIDDLVNGLGTGSGSGSSGGGGHVTRGMRQDMTRGLSFPTDRPRILFSDE